MKKSDLIKMLEFVPDETEILIPIELKFTGDFYAPSKKSSGFMKMFNSESEEDPLEMLNDEGHYQEVFLLCPDGFFDEEDTTFQWN